ncbi:MAG: hypothetical protein ABIG20_01685 [archaeon]
MSVEVMWWRSLQVMLIFGTGMISFFGLKLMMSGFDSPEKRTEIKDYFKNFIYFIVFGFLSAVLYGMAIELSGAVARYLIGGTSLGGLTELAGARATALMSEELVSYFTMASVFAHMTISMQEILLVLGFIVLPLGIGLMFMSFSNSLKTLGYSVVTFFFIIAFLPLADSLIFVAADYAVESTAAPGYIAIAAFWLVGIVNLLAFKAALEVAKSDRVVHTIVEKVNTVADRVRGDSYGL